MDRPSRSTHVTGALIGVGFVVVGVQRLMADSTTLGAAMAVFGGAFVVWHLRRLARLRVTEQAR